MKTLSATARRTATAVLALSTAVVLTACTTAASDSGKAGDSSGPLKIGYIGPLTGGSASLGVPIEHGIQLAVDQVNTENRLGRKLELVTADDKADPSASAKAAQRMVSEDGVVAVLGGPNSGTVLANNPIITGAGVVNVITVAQVDTLVGPAKPGFDRTFRVSENNSYDVDAITRLFQNGGYKAICAVADSTEYGQGGIASIKKVFAKRGLSLKAQVQHEVNATDLTPQVLKLRNSGCDAVYLFDLGQDAAVFMKTVKQVGWKVPVIGGRALNQAAFLSIAGAAADGLVFPSVIDPAKPSTKDFITRYDQKYGATEDPAHTFSALAYDSTMVLVAGLKASGSKGGDALAQALEHVKLEGVTGRQGATLGFSDTDHEAPGANYVTFWTIANGKYGLSTTDVTSGQE